MGMRLGTVRDYERRQLRWERTKVEFVLSRKTQEKGKSQLTFRKINRVILLLEH